MPRLSKIGAAALAAFGWTSGVSAVTATYLVVAGGGGGGAAGGGGGAGGGAGGYRTGTLPLDPALSYTVTVGGGGARGTTGQSGATGDGTSGSDSILSTITSTGGGGGGAGGAARAGKTGGSGGGGGHNGGTGGAGNTPSTSPSQGNNGGTPVAAHNGAGGGGGASAAGATTPSVAVGGAGGAGTASSISGSSVTYAGGGGGASNTTGGAGGAGGGGTGGALNGVAGTANLGGGGGGGYGSTGVAAAGGSGIVIISYVGAQQFGGGVVTSVGGNTIHTFTTSGTLVPITPLSANYLVVAGGGGGGAGHAGGGGAGGLLTGSGVTIDPNSTYLVTVGSGGAGAINNTTVMSNGTNSVFSSFTAIGGGFGGGNNSPSTANINGNSGGSGGGGANSVIGTGTGGAGTSGQGNAGGSGGGGANWAGGGGGGASAAGANNPTNDTGGAGGAGTTVSAALGSGTYAGGGGGGGGSTAGGAGGAGGGGAGTIQGGGVGVAGTANTGGGGGGARNDNGGNGGSGIVIISYAGATQLMAGGTVTISGGNVIHTFTSTGYLAPLKLVNNSLRFRSSASAYLNRTPSAVGSRTTWTYSCWVKRGRLGADQALISAYTGTATINTQCSFMADDTLDFYDNNGSYVFRLTTTQVFRDPAAWYHIVLVLDTTQATASNRVKIYVNGTQITSFSTATYPPLNDATSDWNSNTEQRIGRHATNYFDGYFAEINNIDGQALTPNSFGTFNSYGVWQPITYGGSYGTNGFYLPFLQGGSTYASSFNGTSQLISAPANSVFNFTGDFTAECWYNTSTVTNASQPTLFTIGTDSAGLVVGFFSGTFYCYMLGSGGLMTGATPPLNQWVHVAWVRVGSTNTLYLNGVSTATATVSGTLSSTGGVTVGKTGSSGTSFNYFQGSVSNFRVTNYAVYKSNFIPSTSALTAISGTQLLTLQSATIVDNSTNAFTITNTGTVTSAVSTTPVFANKTTLTADQSPNGNNWTANNTSVTTGSTYDSMTDVPTLTSATAANYCTMNPLENPAGFTLSGGNLDMSGANAWRGTRATIGVTSGKWYWEYVHTSATAGGGTAISTQAGYTWAQMATNNPGVYPGGWEYIYTGQKANNNVYVSYGAAFTQNDVVGVAFDADAGTLVFYKNGVSQGTAYTGLTSGPYFPTDCGPFGGSTYNFGQRPFTYTPPSGFVALNTFNL